jgi:hypothetical protein
MGRPSTRGFVRPAGVPTISCGAPALDDNACGGGARHVLALQSAAADK